MGGYNFERRLSMGKKGTKNAMAGKIYKGSMNHVIYEAVMTNSTDLFTCKHIFSGLQKDYPALTYHKVMATIGNKFVKLGIIEKTGKRQRLSGHKKPFIVFHRIEGAKQPLIHDPNAKDHLGDSKPRRKKKAPEIPTEIDATQLGVAMIDYVTHLQDRIRSLAMELKDTKQKADTQVKEATRQVNIVRHEMDSLKKINEDLKTKLANKNRTFNTREVLDFKRRKAQSGL